jgi:FAD/FMN-containing dehydrogenase
MESYFFKTARQSPACIVKPIAAEDVSIAIKILATSPGVRFAIRSGGHTPNPNQSNVESGVTIDLRGLNALHQPEDREDLLQVGGGSEWDSVYGLLEKSGRSAVGSRESSVGVGGFITGGMLCLLLYDCKFVCLLATGGLSFFSPEFGFSCDNVENFQIVIASGDIVNANAKENTDLFHAIRGGHSNFGIVTRFDIITHARNKFWGGGILYPDKCEDDNLKAFVNLKEGKYDPYAAVVQSFLYFGAQKAFCVSNNMVYLKDVEKPEGLKQFEDIQPQIQGTMRLDTTRSFALELQRWQPINQ